MSFRFLIFVWKMSSFVSQAITLLKLHPLLLFWVKFI